MKKVAILLSLIAFIAVSCEKNELKFQDSFDNDEQESPINDEPDYYLDDNQIDKDVIISMTEYENAPDSYVEIIEAKIEDNYLKIKFSASGCDGNSWNVKLICMGDYMKSNPPQTSLRLSLDNNEDCTAVITKEISFNLDPLIEYFRHFGINKIYLNISGKSILYTYYDQEQVFDLDLLKRSWLHSQEEDGENSYSIYRPSGYKEFPPSRFRQYFEFKDNNVCSYLVLAPNDAHFIQEGVWEYDESTNIIRIINETDVIFEFQILELNENILKLSMIQISNNNFDEFFEEWNRSVQQNSDDYINQNETVKSIFDIYKVFYNPLDLLKLGDWEWGNDLNSGCKYVVIQNKIYYYIMPDDNLDGPYWNEERDSISNFRPPIDLSPDKVLYLTEEYEKALKIFLGSESTEFGEGSIMNPSMPAGESQKRYESLRRYIPILHGHWGSYWHIVTHPEIIDIIFSKNLDKACVYFRVGYQGGEAMLSKTGNNWEIESSRATWIE